MRFDDAVLAVNRLEMVLCLQSTPLSIFKALGRDLRVNFPAGGVAEDGCLHGTDVRICWADQVAAAPHVLSPRSWVPAVPTTSFCAYPV